MLIFSTPLVNCWPYLLSDLPHPFPLLKVNLQYVQTVFGCGEGRGVLSCVVDHILQEFNILFLTRLRTYKIATPPQTKTPVKTTFRDWCLYSSFFHASTFLRLLARPTLFSCTESALRRWARQVVSGSESAGHHSTLHLTRLVQWTSQKHPPHCLHSYSILFGAQCEWGI